MLAGVEGAKKFLAVRLLLRWNSNRLPCKLLVPVRVTTCTVADDARPFSASYAFVVTLNSDRKSGGGSGLPSPY